MSAVSTVSQSAEALSQILKMATQKSVETAEKLVKFNVSMQLGANQASIPGVGENLDVEA